MLGYNPYMPKESKELIDNRPSNFVMFSHQDKSTKPLYGHIEYPIFERDDKTDHSPGIIRISIIDNRIDENFPSSLEVRVWENSRGWERSYASHRWEIKGGKGKFSRHGFSSDGQEYTREICEEVYFDEDLTELHFPEGIVRLK